MKQIIATEKEISLEGIDNIIEIIEQAGDYKTKVKTPEEKEAAFRWIVANNQYLYVNGTIVDGFTASAVVQVFDALNSDSKKLLLNFNLNKIVDIVWKIINK